MVRSARQNTPAANMLAIIVNFKNILWTHRPRPPFDPLMDIRQTVGGNIRRERRRRALSQEALAFEAGVDQAYVSIVENGAGNLTLSLIERFANALDVPPDRLLKRFER